MTAPWESLPQDIVEAEGLSRSEEGFGKFQEDQPSVAIKLSSREGSFYPEIPQIIECWGHSCPLGQ